MSFLALSPWQMWTLALATAGIIAALFFIKPRHPRVLVGSLVLWQRVLEEHRPDSLLERLRRLLSLLLALAIALSVAFALGQPVARGAGDGPERLTAVLDTSVSMLARTADGRTRWEHAIEEARRRIADAGATARFTLVETSGGMPPVRAESRAEALEALDDFTVGRGAGRVPALDTTERVVVFTDGVSVADAPRGVELVSVFEPAVNVGVTAFEVRAIPARSLSHEVFVEVTNASLEPVDTTVSIDVGDRRALREALALRAGATHRRSVQLPPGIGGVLRAYLTTAGDGFPLDDEAFAYVTERPRLRVGLVSPGSPALEAVLEAAPRVELTRLAPQDYAGREDLDAYVFDRIAPAEAPARPSLLVAPPARPWLGQPESTLTAATITSTDASHPLLDHVNLHDVHIDRARTLAGEGWSPLARAGTAPVIATRETPLRVVVIGFALDESDLPMQVAFPMLVANAVSWLSADDLVSGQPLGPTRVPWEQVTVTTHDGRDVPTRGILHGRVFDASAPGIYVARAGALTRRIAANLASASLSSVNDSSLPPRPPASSLVAGLVADYWKWLLAGALLLAALEWWTYHRRVTI
jgi:hypothetical protein